MKKQNKKAITSTTTDNKGAAMSPVPKYDAIARFNTMISILQSSRFGYTANEVYHHLLSEGYTVSLRQVRRDLKTLPTRLDVEIVEGVHTLNRAKTYRIESVFASTVSRNNAAQANVKILQLAIDVLVASGFGAGAFELNELLQVGFGKVGVLTGKQKKEATEAQFLLEEIVTAIDQDAYLNFVTRSDSFTAKPLDVYHDGNSIIITISKEGTISLALEDILSAESPTYSNPSTLSFPLYEGGSNAA